MEIKRLAIWHLGSSRRDRDLPLLEEALSDGDERIRLQAILALQGWPGDQAAALLQRALLDPLPAVRTAAAHAFGAHSAGDETASRMLASRLPLEPDPSVRKAILISLGARRDGVGQAVLIETLGGSGDPSLRDIAAAGLAGYVRTPLERSALSAATERSSLEPDPGVRAQLQDAITVLQGGSPIEGHGCIHE